MVARFEGGYVKLYRSVSNGDIGRNANRLAIFITLLQWANWVESKIEWNGQARTLRRGQLWTTLREISGKLSLGRNTVARQLDYLRKRDTIQIETGTHGTIITFVNYESYAGDELDEGHGRDTDGDAGGTRAGHGRDTGGAYNEEVKKRRKKQPGIRIQYPDEFETVWSTYGKKESGDKADALKAFQDLNLSLEEYSDLEKAIPAYLAECRRKDRFKKHLATFLRSDWREHIPKHPKIDDGDVLTRIQAQFRGEVRDASA